jgi:hypothetical protein
VRKWDFCAQNKKVTLLNFQQETNAGANFKTRLGQEE